MYNAECLVLLVVHKGCYPRLIEKCKSSIIFLGSQKDVASLTVKAGDILPKITYEYSLSYTKGGNLYQPKGLTPFLEIFWRQHTSGGQGQRSKTYSTTVRTAKEAGN